MKYILVTGACGGMGQKAVERLAAQGFGVLALDKKAGRGGRQRDTVDRQ